MPARAYLGLLHAGAVAAALLRGVLALIVNADVVRHLGGAPCLDPRVPILPQLATFMVDRVLSQRAVRVTRPHQLRAGRTRYALAPTGGLAVCAVFVVYGIRAVTSSVQQGSLVIKSIVFPEWWLFAPVPVSFAFLAVEFLRRLVTREPPAGAGPHA